LAVSAVVLLTHPVDAVFLGIGALALAVASPARGRERRIALTVLTMAASALLAFAWPTLPLYDLLFGESTAAYRSSIADADHDMYVNVLARLGLALIVVPFAFRRLGSWRTEPLALMFFGSLAGYAYGFLSENWSYGRLIASAQFVGAIILADERASITQAISALGSAGKPLIRWVQVTTAALVLVGIFFMRNGFNVLPDRLMADVPYNWVHSYVEKVKISDFDFIADNHKAYPVVISDVYTSLEIPTFGSKVIAFARTQAFVDTAQRGTDLGKFYDPASTREERRQILDKYRASLLVVPVDLLTNEPTKYQPLVEMGRVVSRNARFVFVDMRPA
jgi:hypothetical protein